MLLMEVFDHVAVAHAIAAHAGHGACGGHSGRDRTVSRGPLIHEGVLEARLPRPTFVLNCYIQKVGVSCW